MGKLNRAAIISVMFCLSISLVISGCPNSVGETIPSSENSIETQNTSVSSTITEQTESTSTSRKSEIKNPNDLVVKVISSDRSGDCTILRYKDTEILIDTSYGKESINAVSEILEEKKDEKDHTWDYVIFTHPDADHIQYASDFFKLLDSKGWGVGHLIDFGDEREEDQESQDEADALNAYLKARNELRNSGSIEYYSPNETNIVEERKNQEYEIDHFFKLTILYNEAYKIAYRNKDKDNELSVCCLFQMGEQKLLFTGDLEQAGENALLKNHRELLRNVTFFKAGHHGSHTSNTMEFVDWISPAYVAITYNHQITENALANNVSRFLKYTDYIYPTVVKDNVYGAYPLFGNCSFEFDGENVNVTSDANNDCTIRQAIIQKTMAHWYWDLVNRSLISDEINTYFFDENFIVKNDGERKDLSNSGNLSYFNCTLVKYGHYDILIDCGSNNTDSSVLLERLKDYVVDGIIEYIIVSHYHLPNYSQLIGSSVYDEGVFKRFRIENIIDNDKSMTNCSDTAGTAYTVYLSKVLSVPNRISIKTDDFIELPVCDGVKLCVYRGSKGKQQDNEDDYSLVTSIDFNNKQMVFVGDLTNYTWFNDTYGKKLGKVYLLRFPSSYVEYNKMTGFDKFLKITRPEVIVIGSPINHWNNNQHFISYVNLSSLMDYLIISTGKRDLKVYSCGYVNNNVTYCVAGDIDYSLFKNEKMIDGKPCGFYVSCCFNGGSGNKSKISNGYYAYTPDDIRQFPAMK